MQLLPEVPHFSIVVEEPPPPAEFQVDGLPLYIGTNTAAAAASGGTFTVAITSAEEVDPAKFHVYIAKTEPEMLKELEPRIEHKIDSTFNNKINVKISSVIGGE